jgi:hypothetical protein
VSEQNGIVTDEEGNVTVHAPTATASGQALVPGTEPPLYLVYEHEGKPVLYKLYSEEEV